MKNIIHSTNGAHQLISNFQRLCGNHIVNISSNISSKISILLFFLLFVNFATKGQSALVVYDEFTSGYTLDSPITTGGNWSVISGTTNTGKMEVKNTGPITTPVANYNGGTGNYMQFTRPTSSSAIVRARTFTISSGTNSSFYYSFLLNVSQAGSTTEYFLGLTPGVTTGYFSRLYIRSATGGYNIGISKTTPGTYGTSVYSFNTTYLVVVKYVRVTGTRNDSVFLWMNPTISTEPNVSTAIATVDTGTDASSVGTSLSFFARSVNTNDPSFKLDGLRVGQGATSSAAWTALGAYTPPAPPTISFVSSNDTICNGNNGSHIITSGDAISYQWQRSTTGTGGTYADITSGSMDAGITYSNFTDDTLIYTGATTAVNGYAFRCVATNTSGSTNSTGVTLNVNASPTAQTVTGGGTICSGSSAGIGLAGSQTGVNYQLMNGTTAIGSPVAGTGSSLSLSSISAAGTYTVLATSTPANCTNSMTGSATVTVNPLPTSFTVTGGGGYCTGGSGVAVGLSNSATGINYQLKLGGSPVGSPVAGTGSALNFGLQTSAGTYTVEATNTSTSCTSTMTGSAIITIDAPPASPGAILGTFTLCAGATTTLSNDTLGGVWSSSNASLATISTSGVVTGVAAGSPIITYSRTSGGCSTFVTQAITVNPTPSAGVITGGSGLCVATTLALSDTAASGVWSSSNVSVATVNSSGLVSGVSSGTTTISYTVTSGGCTAVATQLVTVGTTPSAGTLSGSSSLCQGATTTLTSTVPGGTWTSSNASIASINSATGDVTGVSGGSVTISYTVTSGCSATATHALTINPLPTLGAITGANTGCVAGTFTLSDTSVGGTWSSSNASVATINSSGLVTGVSVGSSTISFSKTVLGCTSVVTTSISIIDVPTVANITGTTNACVTASSTLSNATAGGSWSSATPTTATVNATTGAVTGVAAGNVIISYTVTNACGSANDTALFTVNGAPTATISGTTSISSGASTNIVFSGTPNATVGYNINGGSTVTATLSGAGAYTLSVTPSITSAYNLTSVQSVAGCTTTITGQTATVTILSGGLITYDEFVSGYTVDSPVTNGGTWTVLSGTGIGKLEVKNTSPITTPVLYYNGGGGNFLNYTRPTANGAIVRAKTYTISSGANSTFYYSFLLNVSQAGSTTEYFLGLTPGLTTGYFARLFIKSATGGGFNIGIGKVAGAGAGTYGSSAYSFNTTYLVVVKYSRVTGATNDTAYLWMNPAVSAEPTTSSAIATINSGTDANAVSTSLSFFSRCVNTNDPSFKLDGLRIGHGNTSGEAWTNLGAFNPPPAPTISTTPANRSVCDGLNTNFSIVASDATSYQWERSTTGTGGTYAPITSSSMDAGITYSGFTADTLQITGASTSANGYAYRCIASNILYNTTSSGATLTVNSLPTAQTVTGGGAYCSGTGGVAIGLGGSQTSVNYQLKNGATNVGSPAAGTGSAVSFGSITPAATYTVLATHTSTGCTNSMTGSAVVSINSLPTAFTMTGGGNYCIGGSGVSVGLSNSSTGINYQLKRDGTPVGSAVAGTGTALNYGLFTTPGTYTIEATNTGTSCVNTMTGSAVVVMDTIPATPPAITGTFSVCPAATTTYSNATSGGTWSSSNASIATVNGTTGVVTGVSPGTATITYTVFNGACSAFAAQGITVNTAPSAGTITGGSGVCVGTTLSLVDTTGVGTWSSSNISVASVNTSGLVFGNSVGSATISYTVTSGGCSTSATQAVTVGNIPSPGVISGAASACTSSTTAFTTTGTGGVWSSSNVSVATVSALGVVTAINAGSTIISYTVTSGCSVSDTNLFTVNPYPTVAAITGPTSVGVGFNITLANATLGGVWSSSNSGIATVDAGSGVTTGVAASAVVISYTKTDLGCATSVTANINVTATAPMIQSVSSTFGNMPTTFFGGDTLVINGTSFNPTINRNKVYFGNSKGIVLSATSTQLTVKVPNGATYGMLSVTDTTIGKTGYAGYAAGYPMLPFLPKFENSRFISNSLNIKNKVDLNISATNPNYVAFGDLDGDNKLDMATCNVGSSTVSIFRNKTVTGSLSADSFQLVTNLTTGTYPINVKMGDMDGDGRLEVLATSAGTARVYVYKNNTTAPGSISLASGTIVSTVSSSLYGIQPQVMSLADFDQDGKLDISVACIYAGYDVVSVIKNNCNVGTINGGSFSTAVSFATASQPLSICTGDFDGDGRPDIAVSCTTANRISIFRNITSTGVINSGSFDTRIDLTTSTLPIDISTADIDGDGKLDLIYANNSSNSIGIRRNLSTSGTISFDGQTNFSTGNNPTGIAIADFNGDSKPDMVATNAGSGTVSFYRNTATSGTITSGSFASPVTLGTGSAPYGLSAGDLDNDGFADVAVANYSSNSISLFKNYPLPYVSPITGNLTVCAAGDTTLLSDSTIGGTWSLTNNVIATIDPSTGIVTGITPGTDTAIYTVVLGGDTNSVRASFIIAPLPTVSAITGASSVCVGASTVLVNTTPFGTWSMTNTNATISSGLVTGVNTGADTAVYTVTSIYGCVTAVTRPMTIQPSPIAGSIAGTTTICQATSTTLSSTGGDAGGTWSSSNTAVATIDPSSGSATGTGGGNVVITYSVTNSCGTAFDTIHFTVNPLPNAGTISGASGVCATATTSLSTTGTGGTWSSSNASLATVSGSGTVTGVAVGAVVISYTAMNSCDTISATHNLNIETTPATPTPISGPTRHCVGGHDTLTSTPSGGTWGSSIVSVATMSSGPAIITGVGNGTTNIVYTISNSCGSALALRNDTVISTPATPGAILGATSVCVASSISLSDTTAGGSWSSSNSLLATVHPSTGAVTGVAMGTPTISYTVTNICGSASSTLGVTVNDIPSTPGPITGNLNVCIGNTTTLSDTTAGGTWSSVNASVATVGAGTGIVTGVSADTTTIQYTVSNVCGTNNVTAVVNVSTPPTATISSLSIPCIGYAGSVTFAGTPSDTLGYKIDGGSIIDTIFSSSSLAVSTGAISTAHTYTLFNVRNAVCSNEIDTTVTITPTQMTWIGGTTGHETDWSTASNWSCGSIPTISDDVYIPSAMTYYPTLITSTSGVAKALNIDTAASIKIDTMAQLAFKGDLNNFGEVYGKGKLIMNNNSLQNISGNGYVTNLELNNATGATVSAASKIIVNGVLTITSGTFTTNDSLILNSDSSFSYRVAPITGGGFSGGAKVIQYVPGGRRAWRFVSHPFNNYIPLNQLQQGIDITGTGGATNGFVTTGSNSASAFRYNPLMSNSTASSDPGWRAFTSTYTTADTNRFYRHQGIRLFIRGAKGEGLSYGSYTPSPAKFSMFGQLNQGNQVVTLQKGGASNQDYNMVGNPYPSPVNIGEATRLAKISGNLVGAAFYVWNPYLATAGMFQAIPINTVTPTPYYLQSNCAFQVRAAHNGDSLNFTESMKSPIVTSSLLRMSNEYVTLNILDENYHIFDMLHIKFDEEATNNDDNDYDALKLTNPDLNFYSIAANGKHLAIDGRPYADESIIPLGIVSNYKHSYIVKAQQVSVPQGKALYLHDKKKQVFTLLQAGTEYKFNISSEKGTQGNDRFELVMKPSIQSATASISGLSVQMNPNPATTEVTIAYDQATAQEVNVAIVNIAGAKILDKNLGAHQSGSITVPMQDLAAGIYMVTITSGDKKVVQKLIKE